MRALPVGAKGPCPDIGKHSLRLGHLYGLGQLGGYSLGCSIGTHVVLSVAFIKVFVVDAKLAFSFLYFGLARPAVGRLVIDGDRAGLCSLGLPARQRTGLVRC